MKRKNLKTYAFILVSALTVLSSCETSARYIGSNEWSGSVNQVSPHPNWLPIGQKEVNYPDTWWYMTNLDGAYSSYEGIYLYEDITLTEADYAFWQNSGSTVTLCLHGYTINGVGSGVSTYDDGGVITVGSTSSGSHSTFTIQDCIGGGTIQANKSVDSGGVIRVNEGATLNLEGGTLTNGSATYDGGAIYCYKGSVNIKGGSISSNKAEKGAGIYNEGGTLSITGGTISDNSASGEGGGVYSGPHVDDTTNTTTDATFTMTGGTIENNTASDGAGIYSEGDLSLTATESSSITITGNTALYDAGGVKFNKFGGDTHATQEQATISLGGNVVIYDNYTCNGNTSLLSSGATTEYNLELSSYSLITFSSDSDSLGSESKIGITYLGLYGDTYQISTNSDTNAINYLSIDNNSDYSDYYTTVENTGNYLELTYKTGVGDSTNTLAVTLEFTFYYGGVIDTSFPTGYGELYIVGDWDDFYGQTDLEYDSTNYTFSITLNDLTVDIHYYELHLSYQINRDDDPLYNYDEDGKLSFKIPVSAVNSTSVTIQISLDLDQPLSDYIPESGNVEKATCTVVFRWWSLGSLLDPQTLEWGDMYIYSNLSGVDSNGDDIWEWSKCNVEEIEGTSYYTLELDNIVSTQYQYSAVLINNNEKIPDINDVDEAWWTSHRVDYNEYSDEYGTNSTFTPVDGQIQYIDQAATAEALSSILPESGYLISDGEHSITLSLDLTYIDENGNTNKVTCPSYGSLYIIGSWHVDASAAWDEWDKLTYNSNTGLYEAKLDSADLIYATTYEYDICFVYDNQPFDWWTNKLTQPGDDIENDYNRHMTFSWKDSETLSHEDSCTLDIDPSSLGELSKGTDDEPMTVYFNIIYTDGTVYQTAYGNNLFVCGSWDRWASFYECEYDEDYIVSYDVVYMVNLPVTSAGSYEFKIVEYTSGSGGSWNGTEIVAGTTDDGNAQITFDATDIACGYKVVTFYYGSSSANVQ